MKFYEKIIIEDFKTKQKELLDLIDGKFPNPLLLDYYDPPWEELLRKCPTLHKYIAEKSKTKFRFWRIYHSPPGGGLGPHIDGSAYYRSPIGLNIPIMNCAGSLMKWWSESNAKLFTGNFGWNGIPATKILNHKELKCVAEAEIDVPTFVRTDMIHSVENYNDKPRIILSIRWAFNATEGQQFEQVMDYTPYEN